MKRCLCLCLCFLFLFLFTHILTPAVFANGLGNIFQEGEQFRRKKAKSPIYLEYKDKIETPCLGAQNGFEVRLFNSKKYAGFIIPIINTTNGYIDLMLDSSVSKEYISEVFKTVFGIFKSRQSKLPDNVINVFYACPLSEESTIRAVESSEFIRTAIYTPSRSQAHLIRKIPSADKTPIPLPSKLKMNDTSLETASVFITRALKRTPMAQQTHFEYAPDLPIEKVTKIKPPYSTPGFRVKTLEGKDVGWVIANYIPDDSKIVIFALWVEENMRRRGFGTAITLQTIYGKVCSHPEVEEVEFITQSDNQAVIKVAERLGFKNDELPPHLQGLDPRKTLRFRKFFRPPNS